MGRTRKFDKTTTCGSRWEVADKVVNNVDLLTEILLRVPAKSLIRFKCVSNRWRNLISDSNFSSKHTQCNPNPLNSAVYMANRVFFPLSHTGSSSHPELSFLDGLHDNPHCINIESSCHGLILCWFYRDDSTRYVVCNPTTRSYRLLPYHEEIAFNSSLSSYLVIRCLCFDPSRSPHYCVVVARFQYYPEPESLVIDIYQSEFSSWEQRLMLHVPGLWGKIYGCGIFCNGAIHWISERGYHIWFDPYSKKLTGIKLPEYPRILARDKIRFFGVCNERLFLIQTQKRRPLGFRVLEMGVDYCSWVKKYAVNLRQLMSVVPDLERDLIRSCDGLGVLSICRQNKEDDDLSLLLSIGGRLISYDLYSKTATVLLDFRDSSQTYGNFFGIRSAYPFFESLSTV